ncbi:SusC/RagA family TonB-linked outer membrane protein [Flammeovirga aprica]|uniref:SusC/RagA family TonB-linked outer membrane protein n=1 Tax=Flammeovirga aprica JL-4 TaxID=694437 RepID=A0A7X9XAX6_9BACT|nr:SusC/RagA family TonB-linked outer membrane protein [Flammeovirga aprica]NME70137.1 SusC/RagA family TonB-linked outer membrane protein [Flammeovirga aprica JL-4]
MGKNTILYFLIFLLQLSFIRVAEAQEKVVVTGVVSTTSGTIPGATIVTKRDPTSGTISDMDGQFKLMVLPDDILKVSFLGYKTAEVPVKGRNLIKITLREQATELDAVIVTGYGSTAKKEDLTGSISRVDSETLEKTNTASFETALQGRMAGVQVTTTGGQPGASAAVRIRGVTSIGGNSAPLYVIDGVPLQSSTANGLQQEEGGAMSTIADINPRDIKSIEVLKDASSTAIYGALGSNGVILITTRQGEEGKAKLNASVTHSTHVLPSTMYRDVLSAADFVSMREEIGYNDRLSDSVRTAIQEGKIATDWQDLIYQQGHTTDGNVRISGGAKKFNFYTSMGLYDSHGIIPNSGYNRFSFRGNMNANLSRKFKIGTTMVFSRSTSKVVNTATNFQQGNGQGSVVLQALEVWPTKEANGRDVLTQNLYEISEQNANSPLVNIHNNIQNYLASTVSGNAYVKYQPIDNFSLESRISTNISQRESSHYRKREVRVVNNNNTGWGRRRFSFTSVTNLRNTMHYRKKIGEIQTDNLLVGELRMVDNDWVQQQAKNFPSDETLYYAMGKAIEQYPSIGGNSQSQMLSGLARSVISYKNRYILTASLRADGASQFSEGNKWGYFPAAALSWKLNNERFLKNVEKLDLLKLRLGFGTNGSPAGQVGRSLNNYGTELVVFGRNQTPYFTYGAEGFTNDALRWEMTKEWNYGLDIALYKSRVTLTADYFKKDTDDLLLETVIPAYAGASSGTSKGLLNMGAIRNEGIELSLTTTNIEKSNFTWTTTFNFTSVKTTFTKLRTDSLAAGYSNGWTNGPTQRLVVGEELGTFFGLKTDGIYQYSDFREFQGMTTEEAAKKYREDIANTPGNAPEYTPWKEGDKNTALFPGQRKYLDLNKDGVINEEDKVMIGRAQPDFTWSFNSKLTYKRLELTVYIYGEHGKDIANMNNWTLGFLNGNNNTLQSIYDKRWTPENPNNLHHIARKGNNNRSILFSDNLIEDASFIRLQRVDLRYRFDFNKVKGSLTLAVDNLYTWTNYSGYNPDVSLGGNHSLKMGHDYGIYPLPTSYNVGLNLNF